MKKHYNENDILIIDGVEYKFITVRNRSKLVSRNGDLINPFRKQKVGLHINKDGYLCSGGGVPVHLYVAYAWVDGYSDDKEVNHKDFNRQNNHADNLEWVTHLENIQKSIDGNYEVICRAKRGENNGRATFTSEKVNYIRELYATGKYSIADLLRLDHPELKEQKAYHSLWSTYANIVHNKTWKHI